MTPFALVWDQVMSVSVFAGIIASFGLIVALLLPHTSYGKTVIDFVHKNILGVAFFINFAALVGSLVYSNVIGYPPCLLCWYARGAFYPQIILFAIAIFKNDRKIIDYAMGLTLFGLLITGFHSFIQWVGETPIPCSADGISCVTRQVFTYGFITIPFMGFVGFFVLFLCLYLSKRQAK